MAGVRVGSARMVVLAVLACVLASGCTARSGSPSSRGSMRPTQSSTGSPVCTDAGQRAVTVFGLMLEAVARDLSSQQTAYVVTRTELGAPDSARRGALLTGDVEACVARGLGRFTHVQLVTSAQDPNIPHKAGSGAIPNVDGGFVVRFGPVPASNGLTQASVDTGGGFGLRGGQFCVRQIAPSTPSVQPCGQSWVS